MLSLSASYLEKSGSGSGSESESKGESERILGWRIAS